MYRNLEKGNLKYKEFFTNKNEFRLNRRLIDQQYEFVEVILEDNNDYRYIEQTILKKEGQYYTCIVDYSNDPMHDSFTGTIELYSMY